MLIAKKDFSFGGTFFKKGEPVVSLTGTNLHKWLYLPGNDVVENVTAMSKLNANEIVVPAVADLSDKKTKNKEA
jgi:hypothetical protein